LSVLDGDGSPAMFIEVHTDQSAQETAGRIRGWHVNNQVRRPGRREPELAP
jgi:hypothetical protein